MKYINLIIIIFYCATLPAQQTYTDTRDRLQLLGDITIENLQQEPFNEWYEKMYDAYKIENKDLVDVEGLSDVKVKLFLGTWCGDSKRLVPAFIKLWEELGLSMDQLDIIAVHNGADAYKQSPDRQDEKYTVHRVPTLIFEKSGTEVARMVEEPVTSLVIDVAQISKGMPSLPNYQGANIAYSKRDKLTTSDSTLRADLIKEVNGASRKSYELITLARKLWSSGHKDEAINLMEINIIKFPYDPSSRYYLGKLLAENGDKEEAIVQLEEALRLVPKYYRAMELLVKVHEDVVAVE